jgi:hypothetical protein
VLLLSFIVTFQVEEVVVKIDVDDVEDAFVTLPVELGK